MTERPELQAYKEFLRCFQVLDMAHARSTDMFGKLKSKKCSASQSKMIRESDKYAPSSP
jgi:hypothetical protein